MTHQAHVLPCRVRRAGILLFMAFATGWFFPQLARAQSATLVADILPTPTADGRPSRPVFAGNTLFYTSEGTARSRSRLFAFDRGSGAARVVDPSGQDYGVAFGLGASGGVAYFLAQAQQRGGGSIWASDGTSVGTRVVAGGPTQVESGPVPVPGRGVALTATDAAHGRELWIVDQVNPSNNKVIDINPGPLGSGVTIHAVLGSGIYVSAMGPGTSGERGLWRVDPAAGVAQLVNGAPLPFGCAPFSVRASRRFDGDDYLVVSDDCGPFATRRSIELMRIDAAGTATRWSFPGEDGAAEDLVLTSTAQGATAFLRTSDAQLSGAQSIWSVDLATGLRQRLAQTALGPSLTVSPGTGPVEISGGRVVFGAERGGAGEELWVSDGTLSGTVRVSDIAPGSASAQPQLLTSLGGGEVSFVARDGQGFYEFYATDGTAGGLRALTVRSGMTSLTQPPVHVTFDSGFGRVYASRSTPAVGTEMFVFDLPTRGAAPVEMQLLADAGDLPGSSRPSSDAALVADLFGTTLFVANDGVHGRELWRTQGDASNTRLLADLTPGEASSLLGHSAVFGRDLVFSKSTGELWRTDGTPQGTRKFFQAGSFGGTLSGDQITGIVTTRHHIVFTVVDAQFGVEPWVSDGTTQGTRLLLDTVPGPGAAGGTTAISNVRSMQAVGDAVFLEVQRVGVASELWVTDGTTAGTCLVRAFSDVVRANRLQAFAAVGDELWFFAPDGNRAQLELWRSDGTAAGTRPVDSPAAPGTPLRTRQLDPQPPQVVGERVFFELMQPSGDVELWASAGSTASTRRVDVFASGFVRQAQQAAAGDELVYIAHPSLPNAGLWISDGSAAAPSAVSGAGSADLSNARLLRGGGREVLMIDDTADVLWRIDVPQRNAVVVGQGAVSRVRLQAPTSVTDQGGALVFAFETAAAGAELFRIDLGASSVDVGVGSGPRGARRAPELIAYDPVIGTTMSVRGAGAPGPGAPAALILGRPAPPIAVLGIDWLLGSSAVVTLRSFTTASASWSQSLPIPNDPSAVGTQFSMQALFVNPSPPLQLEASNAVWIRLGR